MKINSIAYQVRKPRLWGFLWLVGAGLLLASLPLQAQQPSAAVSQAEQPAVSVSRAALSSQVDAATPSVIPVPLKMEVGTGVFRFKHSGKPAATAACPVLPPVKEIRTARPEAGQTDESYKLTVTRKGIRIEAPGEAGLFYARQTLSQLVRPGDRPGTYTVPVLTIEDTPRFAYRGYMLDVSRHFFSKEFVKKQIDVLARYKLNRLHLHLTDAAGWRIEMQSYPRLTSFAAWRGGTTWKDWWNGDRRYLEAGTPGAKGGYYTREDIREIVDYARAHHITVIPEIEMPSHSEEVLAAYPELACSGEPYKNADFCVGNEATFTFLQRVLDEVMDLFPSEYIHIGGDEAGMQAWKTCPRCQQRMKDEHLQGVEELQSYLVCRMEQYLNAHGRKLLGWDEILKGGLAPNATVMSWRGEEGGLAAVRSGHRAIMTPGAFCYLDSYQDAPLTQPEAIGGYLPLQKVYSYNPVPADLSPAEAKLIYGVQANLWTEFVPTEAHVEYMTYPRILALAEVAWSAPERKSWTDFHPRALQAVRWLQQSGYHPFPLDKEHGSRPESLRPAHHLAKGKKVTYQTPYSPSYPAGGDATLTDGLQGDWTYGDGRWQGFIGPDGLDVVIDLGEAVEVHTVTAHFLQVTGPYVFYPGDFTVSYATEAHSYTSVPAQTFGHDAQTSFGVRALTASLPAGVKARYLRVQAHSHPTVVQGGWLFVDELIVR